MNFKTLLSSWKTTLAGILSTIVSLSAAGFFAPNPFISTKVSGYIFAVSGMARILLGVMQSDGVSVPAGSNVKQVTTTTVQTPNAPPTTTVVKDK